MGSVVTGYPLGLRVDVHNFPIPTIRGAHSSSTGFEVHCVASMHFPGPPKLMYINLYFYKNGRPRMRSVSLTT
jgi:hypothetical protein